MSTHGHMPEKGPQPTFLAWVRISVLEKGEIVNAASTFAKVLGLTLSYSDEAFYRAFAKISTLFLKSA